MLQLRTSGLSNPLNGVHSLSLSLEGIPARFSHGAFSSFDLQSGLKENTEIIKVRNLKIILGFTKVTVTILSDRISIYLISHISQILVKNVGMGNWVSWPLLKTFFSLKDNTVSRQRVPAAGTIHHRKSQNTLIYLIIIIESGSRSWKVFPYHFTHCLGGQWEHKTAQKRRMQRTRTSQTQQGAMPLLCFVWGQPRLLVISYLPLILASLEVVNYLLLDTGSSIGFEPR